MIDGTLAQYDDILDWRHRTFPPGGAEQRRDAVADQGWNLLQGDLLLPAMVLRQSALEHNVAVMRAFCDRHGVDLAPHGKTTMSPEIVERQLQAGAWAITAANVQQLRVFRAFGVQRIIIANQVVDPASLRTLAAELAADESFECFCLVDSVATVEVMERELAGLDLPRPVDVLVELGVPGGRTGARGIKAATAAAEAVAASPVLRLAGVEAYEGVIGQATLDATLATVDGFLDEVRELALALCAQGLLDGRDELLLTAGGSAFFDRVVERLGDVDAGRPLRLVLRSGCYVTHDSAFYRALSPLDGRAAADDRLVPALQAWAAVTSRPEPGLALVGFGKRDVPYDLDLPVVELVRRRDGRVEPLSGATITGLNDQHGFVRLDEGAELAVGDWIGCGISHPCTAFDKWRAIPVVDDDYTVVDVARTYF
jgi:D-serine deaminase-like pyridoxal phosphate-dependent protein